MEKDVVIFTDADMVDVNLTELGAGKLRLTAQGACDLGNMLVRAALYAAKCWRRSWDVPVEHDLYPLDCLPSESKP